MHTIEAFATHVWNISPKWSMHDGVRLGYATTYSSVLDVEQFPFFGGDSQRKKQFYIQRSIRHELSAHKDMEDCHVGINGLPRAQHRQHV